MIYESRDSVDCRLRKKSRQSIDLRFSISSALKYELKLTGAPKKHNHKLTDCYPLSKKVAKSKAPIQFRDDF